MSPAKKPVKLQVNTSGAWKDVVRFDADDQAQCDQVMEGAELLGRVGGVTFRICTDDRMQTVLMHWSSAGGWKEWRR